MFILLAWNIWKARCAQLFQEKSFCPEKVLAQALMDAQHDQLYIPIPMDLKAIKLHDEVSNWGSYEGYCAWSDGSFGTKNEGGAAFLMGHKGHLIRYELQHFGNAISPFHMEVIAVLMAVKYVVFMQIQECIFLTDSKLLVDALDPTRRLQPLLTADWRSYSELMQLANFFRKYKKFGCRFIPREDNKEAHQLANRARREQFNYWGHTFPIFPDDGSN